MSMYAKLMSRITESSLMEESITVRYVFMMLLAVADPKGYAVGTDVALARRLNMDLAEFKACVAELMKPDPDSNSKEEDGRRIIDSDVERGYFVVNYAKYRDTRNEEERREWMRDYMQKYRAEKKLSKPVNGSKPRKLRLAKEEVEVSKKEEQKTGKGESFADWFKGLLPEDIRLSGKWRDQWAKLYDDMIRLDKRTPRQITDVCKWARGDEFWQANFLTPIKLRDSKNGVQYFDIFLAKLNPPPPAHKAHQKPENPNLAGIRLLDAND